MKNGFRFDKKGFLQLDKRFKQHIYINQSNDMPDRYLHTGPYPLCGKCAPRASDHSYKIVNCYSQSEKQ